MNKESLSGFRPELPRMRKKGISGLYAVIAVLAVGCSPLNPKPLQFSSNNCDKPFPSVCKEMDKYGTVNITWDSPRDTTINQLRFYSSNGQETTIPVGPGPAAIVQLHLIPGIKGVERSRSIGPGGVPAVIRMDADETYKLVIDACNKQDKCQPSETITVP